MAPFSIQKITQPDDPRVAKAAQFLLQAFDSDPAFAGAHANPNPKFAGYVRDGFQLDSLAKSIAEGTSLHAAIAAETRELVGVALTQYFEPDQIPQGWIQATNGFLGAIPIQYWDWGIVRRDWQGRGVGRELYRARDAAFREWLAARGETREALQFLMVLETNPNRAVHEHGGFSQIGRGILFPELVLMARPFDPGN